MSYSRWRKPGPTLLEPMPLRFPQHHWTFETWANLFAILFFAIIFYAILSGMYVRHQPWMDLAKHPDEAGIGIIDQGGGATPGLYMTKIECIGTDLHVKLECVKDALRLPIQP